METTPVNTSQRIVVVRHGETEWSRIQRHTGRSDLSLTATGREQAKSLITKLAGLQFTAVFVSPLRRARETCEIAGFADRAVIDPDLIEWDYGAYEGLTSNEIQVERPGWTLFRDGVIGGETIDDVAARAARVITRVRSVDGNVLLFGHGHQLRITTALWLDFPALAAQRLQLATASPSTLGYEHDWTALLRWNG
ncbi:MAG: histidine phosphatase family protein [Candidatus Dormibacteria bacterium]